MQLQDNTPLEFPEKLAFLLFESARLKIAYGGRGAGKCLATGTKVIMADGSLRAVEDVNIGDNLMGPDSWPRRVLGTTRGRSMMYKIHQTSGMDYVVNDAHILSLKNSNNEITNINVENLYDNSQEKNVELFGWNYKSNILSQIEIEPIGEGEYAGFSLDGDHLFLLEDGTVTHNTENFARAAILLSRTKKIRILCGREFQNSIDESVKATIEANIEELGLEEDFIITKKQIICKSTGSRFMFMGLRYNIAKIKSMGRIDICWIEEADKTSANTLDKLFPTIRGRSEFEEDRGGPFGNGPEIWISFNPDLEDDEVYKRFVLNKLKYAPEFVNGERYAIVAKVNYWDNKWFPPDLALQMEVMRNASEDKYLEVWEGNTKQVLEGSIYANELQDVLKEGRRKKVAYDPNKPVLTYWDLGHSDKTAIWFVQRAGVEFNVINYYEDRLKKIPFYVTMLNSLGYNYSVHNLPHDGSAETVSNITPEKQLRKAFPNATIRIVQRPAKKAIGINAVRSLFPLLNFDEENTSNGWQCLARYAYKVDEDTGVFSKEPEHDTPWSHGADGMQTMALSIKSEADERKPNREKAKDRIRPQMSNGWMGSL